MTTTQSLQEVERLLAAARAADEEGDHALSFNALVATRDAVEAALFACRKKQEALEAYLS